MCTLNIAQGFAQQKVRFSKSPKLLKFTLKYVMNDAFNM